MTNKAEGTHLVSNTLNAEELLRKRRQWSEQSATCVSVTQDLTGYADAIREVAQPIADERDMLKADRSALLRERDALQAFKDYVHQRLDEAAIATHPPGEHADAGCRVGQRMDLLVGERDEAKRLHMELIYAVARKFDGESRHETALRYIEEAEKRSEEGSSVSTLTPDQK